MVHNMAVNFLQRSFLYKETKRWLVLYFVNYIFLVLKGRLVQVKIARLLVINTFSHYEFCVNILCERISFELMCSQRKKLKLFVTIKLLFSTHKRKTFVHCISGRVVKHVKSERKTTKFLFKSSFFL